MNHGLCVWWSDTRGVSLSTPLRTSPQPLMRTTLIPNGGTSKGCGSSPSSVLGHRAIRTAKGSNYGPQKGQTTDRKRVKLRTAKGSNYGPQKGHPGPKGHNMGQRGHKIMNTSRHLPHGYLTVLAALHTRATSCYDNDNTNPSLSRPSISSPTCRAVPTPTLHYAGTILAATLR